MSTSDLSGWRIDLNLTGTDMPMTIDPDPILIAASPMPNVDLKITHDGRPVLHIQRGESIIFDQAEVRTLEEALSKASEADR